MEASKRMRVTPKHWDMLLNILGTYPEMVTGKFMCPNAKQKSSQLWEEAAIKLNALGLGEKTADKWKIALQDWKYKTKAKASEIREYEKKTGGGPPSKLKLNEQEERLMNIIGWSSVTGCETVPESGLGMYNEPVQMPMDSDLQGSILLPSTDMQESAELSAEYITIHVEDTLQDEGCLTEITSKEKSSETCDVQESKKSTEPNRKRKVRTDDATLEVFQQETMAVLKEIVNGIKAISIELKSISNSLSVIANKTNDPFI